MTLPLTLRCLLAGGGLLLAGTTAHAQAPVYNFYYGNLHAHSSYSDGNQDSAASKLNTPLQDYQFAAASLHFDFEGISEHNHSQAGMHLRDYPKGHQQAVQATTTTFVALSGTEWGIINNGGHTLLYGVNKLYGWESGNYNEFVAQHDYTGLWRKINQVPGAFASFAHPQSDDYNDLLHSAFNPAADSALIGVPLRSGPANSTSTTYADKGSSYESIFRQMLAKGYHVGVTLDHDNHKTTFGRMTHGRLVVLAEHLTEVDLLTALRARRCYGSEDWNAKVTLSLGDQPMGSILTGSDAAALSVSYADDDNEALTSLILYRGVPGSGTAPVAVATSAAGVTSLSYTDPAATGAAYYYAAVLQADGDRMVTSPIWYTRNAVALATAGAVAKLPLDVFPNPTRNTATLSYYLPAATSISAEVFDEVGRSVVTLAQEQRQAAGPQTLAVPALPAGLYTVRLLHDGVSEFRKLAVE